MNIYAHANQFIDNKYTCWYYAIVVNAQKRTIQNNAYYEKHHILPKCIFPEHKKEKWNLVSLTAREHFICHLLLTKMTKDKNRYKMLQAAISFNQWITKKQNRQIDINSRTFEKLKKDRSDSLKEMWQTDETYRNAALAGFRKKNLDPEYLKIRSQERKILWTKLEYINKMKNRPKTFKKVEILGKQYNSLIEAGNDLGITSNLVSKRCSSQQLKFIDWKYL